MFGSSDLHVSSNGNNNEKTADKRVFFIEPMKFLCWEYLLTPPIHLSGTQGYIQIQSYSHKSVKNHFFIATVKLLFKR